MTTRRSDGELMQRADGELASDGAVGSEDARKLEALGELGELVRGHLELSADAVPARRFADMWREIDKGIDLGVAKVAEPARDRERAAAAAGSGWWAGITGWFERYRGHVITGAVSAGAVAALALVLRGAPSEVAVRSYGAIDVRPASLRSPPAIEALDTPDGTGTVLNLEDEDGHTAVIWVTPADTVEGI